jgi:superfamily II DNA or RNA helicase
MIDTTNGKIEWGFSISYSTYSTYLSSPLIFFFDKIMKAKPSNEVIECYGLVGKAIHTCAEEYIKNRIVGMKFILHKLWHKYDLEHKPSFKGILWIGEYESLLDRLKKIIDDEIGSNQCIAEHKIEFTGEEYSGINIKGFIDVVMKDEMGRIILYDWKTNARSSYEEHKLQRLFYSWLYYKKYGVIPHACKWKYLKTNETHEDSFTIKEINNFDKEIIKFIEGIKKRGNDINNYEVGDYSSPFNAYKDLCEKEVIRRTGKKILKAKIINNRLSFLELPEKLLAAMWQKYSYEVQGAEFSDAYKEHRWDGKKHMVRMKDLSIPLAYTNSFIKLLKDYNEHFGVDYELMVEDCRDKDIIRKVYDTEFKSSEVVLRPYQEEAVNTIMKKNFGIINLPPSSGKTIIAAELIKRLNRKTLFIINRKELVHQTVKEFKEYLGVKVGMMYQGMMVTKEQIIVCSIQTISAILARENDDTIDLKHYLRSVTACIYDECHGLSNSKMYSAIAANMPNIVYSCGLSGTDWRNDGATLEMNSLVGMTEYSKTLKEMEEKNYIAKLRTYFITTDNRGETGINYMDEYSRYVINSNPRNKMICDMVEFFRLQNRKVLIITKSVLHANELKKMIPNTFVITGVTDNNSRREKLDYFKESDDDFVIISSLKIAGTGLNIKKLSVIINCAANKSSVDTIQVFGRVGRLFKEKQGLYIDFYDTSKYLKRHAEERMEILKDFGYKPTIISSPEEIKDG